MKWFSIKVFKRLPGLMVVGAGGHGRAVADVARSSAKFSQIVFIDPQSLIDNQRSIFPVYANAGAVPYKEKKWFFIVALGDNAKREREHTSYIQMGYEPTSIFHPSATISPYSDIDLGSVVMANAHVGPCACIGKGVIINTGAIVEHDVKVANFSHVAPGAILAGGVSVGTSCIIGASAVVRNGIAICEGVIVGQGGVVVKNILTQGTYVGNPVHNYQRDSTI